MPSTNDAAAICLYTRIVSIKQVPRLEHQQVTSTSKHRVNAQRNLHHRYLNWQLANYPLSIRFRQQAHVRLSPRSQQIISPSPQCCLMPKRHKDNVWTDESIIPSQDSGELTTFPPFHHFLRA
ncbi:hypothetical protein J6590_002754 [Homalodisca vitripennis]|nr:hypothetical protein J6590_002754 [Homalodisca vitripennis]